MYDLPRESWLRKQRMQESLTSLIGSYGYRFLETPLLEGTELFLRQSGGDLASRMYSFVDAGSNQVSLLRLINSADTSTVATVRAIDDAGRSGGTVRIPLPARTTRTLSAQELESGAAGVNGAFGDGKGKWRIDVESDRPITVMSLLSSPTGHLTNLSAASLRRTAGQ